MLEIFRNLYSYEAEEEEEGQEDDSDEALSLRDLPLTTTVADSAISSASFSQISDSYSDHFEFLASAADDVSPADDIMFCGRILPLNFRAQPIGDARVNTPDANPPRRSGSLSPLRDDRLRRTSSLSSRDGSKLAKSFGSLDNRRLNRSMSSNTSVKEHRRKRGGDGGKSDWSIRRARPRWYVIMFRMVKRPPQIEMKDIKRRVRRGGRNPGEETSTPSWKFIKALSCHDPRGVSVTTPIWIPHA